MRIHKKVVQIQQTIQKILKLFKNEIWIFYWKFEHWMTWVEEELFVTLVKPNWSSLVCLIFKNIIKSCIFYAGRFFTDKTSCRGVVFIVLHNNSLWVAWFTFWNKKNIQKQNPKAKCLLVSLMVSSSIQVLPSLYFHPYAGRNRRPLSLVLMNPLSKDGSAPIDQ